MKKIWIGVVALLGVLIASLVGMNFLPGNYAAAVNIEYTDMLNEDGIYIVYADDCGHCIADEPTATDLIKENEDITFKSINSKKGENVNLSVYSQPESFLTELGYVVGAQTQSDTFYQNIANNNIGQTDASKVFISGTPSYFGVKDGKVVAFESGAGQLSTVINTYKGAE